MGAMSFYQRARGSTAREAFQGACRQALHQSGHGRYTGTIAEKSDYTMIKCPPSMKPEAYAEELITSGDSRVKDKWGPAGCIDCGGGEFLFFGIASS